MQQAIFRGILIGGALGVIATFALGMSPPRAFFLGVVAGVFAGVTRYKIEQRRNR